MMLSGWELWRAGSMKHAERRENGGQARLERGRHDSAPCNVRRSRTRPVQTQR